jgi:alpha-mannosidase
VRSPNATYEMPFGYAERPTHYSSSFDRARYEVPGHRFADLSEHGFGAALLSDSKYGFSCYGGDLKLTLLRSPRSPDPEADLGRHDFAYAVLPHAGGWREGGVLREAILFNAPLVWTDGGPEQPFAAVEGELVLDTVKRAEDTDDVVLRLYEPYGGRGVARVRVACTAARRCNLLEEDGEELAVEDGAVVVPYRPHEVISLKLS